MPFQLQIEFSGLCLFVLSKDKKKVGVLMPDARRRPNTGTLRHVDHTPAVPHAGYLRFDLHDLRNRIPGSTSNADGPAYEAVHRFSREALDLDLPLPHDDAKVGVDELVYPDLHKIDDNIELLPGLFRAPSPPQELLMRMELTGGEFTSHSGGSNWTFPTIDTRGGTPYQGQFANYAVWTRTINRDQVTLKITPFKNEKHDAPADTPVTIELTPRGDVIKLKIANLCAENPLEWSALDIRTVSSDEDLDFKWFYRLLKNPKAVRAGLNGELPVPVLDMAGGVAGRDENCTGGIVVGDI